jgi:hypothetical protein
LISVKRDVGQLVGPPPGLTEYKTREELSADQYAACMSGKVFRASESG